MKANEAITLDACLLALLHYGDSVPLSLHEQIQLANQQLANRQPGAVKQLKDILQQDEQLDRLYTASRRYLITQYGQQERAKSAVISAPIPSAVPSIAIPNSINSFGFGLIDLATEILSSPDANYRTKAQQVFRQPKVQKQLEKAPEDLKVSAKELANAASMLHPTKVAVMKKLDKKILTVDDVAFSIEIPIEKARRYIQSLWNEGYVRPISGNFLKQIWLAFKGAPRLEQPPADDTYLTLTAKGHFYLHPGILSKRQVA